MNHLLERPTEAPVEAPTAPAPAPTSGVPRPSRLTVMAWVALATAVLVGKLTGLPNDEGTGADFLMFLGLGLTLVYCGGKAVLCLLADLCRLGKHEQPVVGWVSPALMAAACVLLIPRLVGNVNLGCGGGPNQMVHQEAYLVHQSLEAYAAEHHGHLPPRATWIATLAEGSPATTDQGALRPVRTLGATVGQTAALTPAMLGLPGATDLLAAGQVVLGKPLAGGQRAAHGAPARADDYGAVLYDVDPVTDTYVIYAIGKREGHAAVVAMFSNGDTEGTFIGPPAPATTTI